VEIILAKMDRACSTHGRNAYRMLVRKMERDHLENLVIDRNIILERILGI
jgi:hypothetical protein